MTRRRHSVVAGGAALVTLILVGLIVALGALTPPSHFQEDIPLAPFWLALPVYPVVMAGVGTLISRRRPENAIGWVMCITALFGALIEVETFYVNFIFAGGSFAPVPIGWAVWFSRCLWLPWVMLQLIYLPVLFPDGRLPSRRWRWLLWTAAATTVFAVLARSMDIRLAADLGLSNPAGIPDPAGRIHNAAQAMSLALILLATASLASVFIRLRNARGARRQQLKWFVLAITFSVPAAVGGAVADELLNPTFPLAELLIPTVFVCIPVAVAFAVFRYRLYEIDLVINRTLLYGMLAFVIAAGYVAVVAGAGALVGMSTQVTLLPLLAAGAVALAFQPLRVQLEKLANRLVYGRRADPYDALAALSRQTARMKHSEQLLTDTLCAVCQAVGLPSASIVLRVGDEYRLIVEWPPQADPQVASGRPSVERGVALYPVHDQGVELGVMSARIPSGRTLSVADDRLLADVAGQAGLLLRNLGLAADLLARMTELRESRRRLVTAQEQERRRIERNLHDGAQQDLFNLRLGLRQVRTLLERSPDQAAGALVVLEEQADAAWRTIKELARGVYPPLLTSQGIVSALSARARTAPLDVRVRSEEVGRYPAEIEEAVYYACAEALQNAVQHADASTVVISLAQGDGNLTFTVRDDGLGIDPIKATWTGAGMQGMRDRMDVVGGSLEVVSKPGNGCEIRGRVPVAPVLGVVASGPHWSREAEVERGHREQVEERAGHEPAEDHDRERILDLVAGPVPQHHQRDDS